MKTPTQNAPQTGQGRPAAAKRTPERDPHQTFTLADFASDFVENMPKGAEKAGQYTAADGDRWSDPDAPKWTIDNGTHRSKGWAFTFRDGRFVSASQPT